MLKLKLFLLLSFSILIFSCSENSNTNIAVYEGGSITIDDYVNHFLESTRYKPTFIPDEQNLEDIVHKLAVTKLSVVEGFATQIDSDTAFIDLYNKNNSRILFHKYMRKMIIDSVITDSLIQKYYAEFSPQYHMYYIMRPVPKTSTHEFDQSQKKVIEQVYSKLEKGEDFHKLAETFSQDITTNKKGGDLGWIIRESLGDKVLRSVMDTLKQGNYSAPIKGYEGWYVVLKGEMRNVPVPSFQDAESKIWKSLYNTRKHIMQEILDEKFNSVKDKYQLEINYDNINKIVKSTGSDTTTPYKFMDFSNFPPENFEIILATFTGGKIVAGEVIRSIKKSPDNYKDFQKRFKSLCEQYIMAEFSKTLGFEQDPEVVQENENYKQLVMKNLVYQKNVRDKAIAKVDELKAELEKTTNPADLSKVLSAHQVRFENELNKEFEEHLFNKYNLQIVKSNIPRALKIAEKMKKEQEEKK